MSIGSSDLVRFGMNEETTEGTFETGSAYPVILTRGVNPSYPFNITTDDTVDGDGDPLSAEVTLRGLDLTTPARLRYNDCRTLVAAVLRDVFPSAVTIVGSGDVEVLTNGTHLDGGTGAQIRVAEATPAVFDSLITYGGVTSSTHPRGGAESLLFRSTGFGDSKNNWHRRVEAVWKNATHSHIDIGPGWVGGTAGFFGEPMAAQASQSPTLAFGQAIRNRITGTGVKTYSAMWHLKDIDKYGGGFGLTANDLSLSWSGKDGVELSVDWIGWAPKALASSDPSGQGFTDNNLVTAMLTGAHHLNHVALVKASELLTLTPNFLNGLSFQVAGSSAAIEDTSGDSKRGPVRRGMHVPSGTIDYYIGDDNRAEKLSALGDQSTEAKGEVSCMWKDPAGNEVACAMLWNAFGQTGAVPGAAGSNVGGSLEFAGIRLTNTSRSFIWQEIGA